MPGMVPILDALIAELEIHLARRGLTSAPGTSPAVDNGTFLIEAYPSLTTSSAKAPAVSQTRVKKLADDVRVAGPSGFKSAFLDRDSNVWAQV